jgi:hypothetical protein
MLNRKRTILAKIEASYGVDPTPTGAANAILVRNLNPRPQEAQTVPRDLVRPYLGNSENLPTAIHAKLDFEVEMAGSGAAGTAPAWGPLLRACAFSETINAGVSVVYAPVSAAMESITLYFNVDGVLHKLFGARGTVSIGLANNQIPVFRFSFTGLYQAVVDAAAPSVTLTAWQKPLPVNRVNTTGFSLHGFSAGKLADLSVDAANEVVFRSLVGGTEEVLITDRKPAGSVLLEAVTVATKDWWTSIKDAATGALSITQGTVAGNKVKLDAPAVQLINPQYQDSQGVAMLQAGMVLVPGSSGNDELTITAL